MPVRAENNFVLLPEDVEKRVTPKTKLLLINSPCNPTGAVYDRATLEGIARVVEKHDLLVISDEIYEALNFSGEQVCFATLPGMRDRTFTMGGFSKTYAMTGLRLGYIIADASFFPALSILSANMAMSVNSITQRGALAALRDCQYYADDISRIYRERAQWTMEFLDKIPGISYVPPGGTFYLMMDVSKTGMKSLDFSVGLLKETRVATIAGIAFGPSANDYVRISYNGSREFLEEAIGRIGRYVNRVMN
jgi:aminotransferase